MSNDATITPLRSFVFRRERESTWRRLEWLVQRVEKQGIKSLKPDEVAELPSLYRATMSSVSVARSITLDRNLIDYLESLSQRAFLTVYGLRQPFPTLLRSFVLRAFPGAVRTHARWLAASTAFFLLGVLVSFTLVHNDPERFHSFVARDYAAGRGPQSSTETLARGLYDTHEETDELGAFASFLFTHNATIGLAMFALGFLAGIPVVLMLFSNGALLGAFLALYGSRNLGFELGGWLLPHGVTEILALLLCGAAGLRIGHAMVFPGPRARLAELARQGRSVAPIVLGAIVLFLIAGGIEGIFRQRVTDDHTRWMVVGLTSVAWLAYFRWSGRR